ncbi:hypothetical protein [Polaribacter sp. R77954]|uniref:hypothetical protein n=1 Tax=Polaribacter sp. R77954 TaxID=3093870 RepID=UPI0037C52FD8
MNIFKKIIPFLFPILIIVFGLVIYKIMDYEPNFYSILINISLAYILSPKFKTVIKQSGEEEQIKWLFFKKVIDNN